MVPTPPTPARAAPDAVPMALCGGSVMARFGASWNLFSPALIEIGTAIFALNLNVF